MALFTGLAKEAALLKIWVLGSDTLPTFKPKSKCKTSTHRKENYTLK